jgi:ketosteroid isomerase-like protein
MPCPRGGCLAGGVAAPRRPHRRNLVDHRCEQHPVGGSGDLAYTLGYEHAVLSMDGGPVGPLNLRITHLYRREDDEWKIVHRHADRPPVDQNR